MSLLTRRYRTYLVLPITLLLVNVLEEIAAYKVQHYFHDIYVQTAIMVVLYGVGFAIAASVLTPWVKRLFVSAHKGTKKSGGSFGLLVFYILSFGMIYYAYFILYAKGVAYLIPPDWR